MDYNVSKSSRKRPRGEEAGPSTQPQSEAVTEPVGKSGAERDCTDLPEEVLVKVLRKIPPVELLSARLVCKTWDTEITGGKTWNKAVGKQQLDEAPRMLNYVAPPSRPWAAVAVPKDRRLMGKFSVLNRAMTEWTPLDMSFLSNPFGDECIVSSVASDCGLLVLNLVHTRTFQQLALTCNPITKQWKQLRPNHHEARFKSRLLKGANHDAARSARFVSNGVDRIADHHIVEHIETTGLSAVVSPGTRGLHLHYWVAADYLPSCRFRNGIFEDFGSRYTMQVSYESAEHYSDRHSVLPETFPQCVFENLVDTIVVGNLYYSIFLEHCRSAGWCSFRLLWSAEGFPRNPQDVSWTRDGGRKNMEWVLSRQDRQDRILIPFGRIRRHEGRDTEGVLVVVDNRLFFAVNGCDTNCLCNGQNFCGGGMHIFELMPAKGSYRYVKLGRMPYDFYRRLFNLRACKYMEEAYSCVSEWPENRRTWGAAQHYRCILFYAWGALATVAFRVPDPLPDEGSINPGPLDNVIDESLWNHCGS